MIERTNERREGKRIKNYFFYFDEQIGEGNFARIYRCLNQSNGTHLAIKVMNLNKMRASNIQALIYDEIGALERMNHRNTLFFHEALLSTNHAYIVTELCNGGTLAQAILHCTQFSQASAKPLLRDIVEGLKHLNKLKIVHRDLKPANIFLHDGVAKIADYGFAKRYNGHKFIDIDIGSALYMAPQALLECTYSDKTDVWALGVIMYEMLHGYAPLYFCHTQQDIKNHVRNTLSSAAIDPKLSFNCTNLLLRLLNPTDQLRPTIFQISQHPFFNPEFKLKPNPTTLSNDQQPTIFIKKNYNQQSNINNKYQQSVTQNLKFQKGHQFQIAQQKIFQNAWENEKKNMSLHSAQKSSQNSKLMVTHQSNPNSQKNQIKQLKPNLKQMLMQTSAFNSTQGSSPRIKLNQKPKEVHQFGENVIMSQPFNQLSVKNIICTQTSSFENNLNRNSKQAFERNSLLMQGNQISIRQISSPAKVHDYNETQKKKSQFSQHFTIKKAENNLKSLMTPINCSKQISIKNSRDCSLDKISFRNKNEPRPIILNKNNNCY